MCVVGDNRTFVNHNARPYSPEPVNLDTLMMVYPIFRVDTSYYTTNWEMKYYNGSGTEEISLDLVRSLVDRSTSCTLQLVLLVSYFYTKQDFSWLGYSSTVHDAFSFCNSGGKV